ncbi:hypothetical protein ACVJH7_004730 [Bradyrhizobium elkanii]
MRMSTFSWSIRRLASLIATSGLLWESTLTGAILYLPPTPPFSLTRSIAIWVPIEEATEPPAANGPGERAGQVVDHTDPDRLGLRLCPCPIQAESSGGSR